MTGNLNETNQAEFELYVEKWLLQDMEDGEPAPLFQTNSRVQDYGVQSVRKRTGEGLPEGQFTSLSYWRRWQEVLSKIYLSMPASFRKRLSGREDFLRKVGK